MKLDDFVENENNNFVESIKEYIKQYISTGSLRDVDIYGNKINIDDEYTYVAWDPEKELLKVVDVNNNTAIWTLDELVDRVLNSINLDGVVWKDLDDSKKEEYVSSVFYYKDEV